MLKVWFFHVFPCFPILFQLEKLTSLHIFFSLPTGTSWGSQPRRLPCRAALRWSAAFCWHLGPRNCGKTMEWEDHTVASCWFFKNVPIAHCCLSMFINVYHRILFRKFQILLERPQPLVQLLRMVNCCWFRASHSLMLVISPF